MDSLLLNKGYGIKKSTNLEINGFKSLDLFSIIKKNLVVLLYCSIHLLNADCASIVKLPAFNNMIVLKSLPLLLLIWRQ